MLGAHIWDLATLWSKRTHLTRGPALLRADLNYVYGKAGRGSVVSAVISGRCRATVVFVLPVRVCMYRWMCMLEREIDRMHTRPLVRTVLSCTCWVLQWSAVLGGPQVVWGPVAHVTHRPSKQASKPTTVLLSSWVQQQHQRVFSSA